MGMQSVTVHANDAEAFIKMYGQPKEAENGPTSTTMRYEEGELDDEALEIAEELAHVRAISGNPNEGLLIFTEDENEATVTINEEFIKPELEEGIKEGEYTEPDTDEGKGPKTKRGPKVSKRGKKGKK